MSENAKSRTVAITLASIPYTGWLGIDRFYLGRYFTGILKLLLSLSSICGMFFISNSNYYHMFSIIILPFILGTFAWYITDIVLTCSHTATDKWGRPLQRRQPVLYGAPVYTAPPAASSNGEYGQNQVYNYGAPGGGQPAISKKKNPLVIVGIILGSVIAFTIFLFFITYFLNSMGVKNELALHELKVKYPIVGWIEESQADADTVSITKGESRIMLKYTKSNVYYSTSSVADEFIRSYKDTLDNFNLHGTMQEVTIHNTGWIKFEFSGMVDGKLKKGMQLVHSTDFEIYTIAYTSNGQDYDKYLDEANEITNSAYLPAKETNAQSVKQQIIGEWDCGNTGTLVINSDDTYYFYKDSSKSSDNVVSGTYEAIDGIPTNAAGYAQGVTFIATIQNLVADGTEQPAAAGSTISYAFTPDGTGDFMGSNLNTGSTFKMTRIK